MLTTGDTDTANMDRDHPKTVHCFTSHVEQNDSLQVLLLEDVQEPGAVEDAAVPVDGDGHGDAPIDGGHEGVVARL